MPQVELKVAKTSICGIIMHRLFYLVQVSVWTYVIAWLHCRVATYWHREQQNNKVVTGSFQTQTEEPAQLRRGELGIGKGISPMHSAVNER